MLPTSERFVEEDTPLTLRARAPRPPYPADERGKLI